MRRTKVALNLPTSVPALIGAARHIVDRMTGNPAFPSPSPSLADVDAAITTLDAAETSARDGGRGKATTRNAKLAALNGLLQQLAAYVEGVANADPDSAATKIESAGMHVRKSTASVKPPFSVKQGRVSGEAIARVRAAAKVATYEWQVSLDAGKTWVTQKRTMEADVVLPGLPPGTLCSFRYRVLLRSGEGNWSDALPFLVK